MWRLRRPVVVGEGAAVVVSVWLYSEHPGRRVVSTKRGGLLVSSPAGADVSAVIESMAVGYVRLARDWQITYVNSAAEPGLGKAAAELVGRDLWEMFPGARDLEFGRVYESVMDTRRPASLQAFYPGLGVWFELRVQPFEEGITVYFLDVTAQKQAVAEAEVARQQLTLLTQVSEALTTTDDPDEAVGLLARLVVPRLADWSVVTVIDEDGQFRDVGWAHRDPEREDDVAAYGAMQSASMSADSPVATGLRTGQPVIVPFLSDEALQAALDDPAAIEIARRLDPHGVAILPLAARGRTFGMIALVTTRARGPHTDDELRTALEVSRRAGPVLHAARTAARASGLAESMQRSMLDVFPARPGLQIATRYRPAYDDRRVGGDWYDTFPLPDGSTVVAIGDVMGHDVAAIAAMAQLRTMTRTTAWTRGGSPAEVLSATNDASLHLGPAVYATAISADLGPAAPDGSVRMRWSNAGHPPPLLVTVDGEVQVLRTDVVDIPLGVRAGAVRHDHTLILPPGATVLLYTDGLIERRERDIDSGIAQLADALGRRHTPTADLDALLDGLLEELIGSSTRHDDVALVAVRISVVSEPPS